ncbi:hypothetical protein [Austwickia sp. TVS 96-490-7B]|nr:hypothetical protein [Austwickia sp. TVS 96-490-7B]
MQELRPMIGGASATTQRSPMHNESPEYRAGGTPTQSARYGA